MSSPRRFFLALDGSERSLSALAVVAPVAARADAELTAVIVCPPWRDCAPAVDWLDNNVASAVKTTVIVSPDTTEALLEIAAEAPGSVLCMSSHGRTGQAELALGSVSSAVVRDSPVPVLMVGPRAQAPLSFATIEVCIHGLPEHVIGPTLDWATMLAASTCLAVVQGPGEPFVEDTPVGAELTQIGAALRARGLHSELALLHSHDPATEIVRHAASLDAALLIATTHARRGIRSLLLGSVARVLVREAHCPVLLVGPSVAATDLGRGPVR